MFFFRQLLREYVMSVMHALFAEIAMLQSEQNETEDESEIAEVKDTSRVAPVDQNLAAAHPSLHSMYRLAPILNARERRVLPAQIGRICQTQTPDSDTRHRHQTRTHALPCTLR